MRRERDVSSSGQSFPGRKSSNCRGPEAGVRPAGLGEDEDPGFKYSYLGGDMQEERSERCTGAGSHSSLRDRTGDCCYSNWSRKPLERVTHHLNSALKRPFWLLYNQNVRGESGSPESRRRQLWEALWGRRHFHQGCGGEGRGRDRRRRRGVPPHFLIDLNV